VHSRAIAADDGLPDALVVDDNSGHRIAGLLAGIDRLHHGLHCQRGGQALLGDQALCECRRRHQSTHRDHDSHTA